MQKIWTKLTKNKFKPSVFSLTVLLLFTLLNIYFFQQVLQIKTHYSLEQFQPKDHPLLSIDKKVRERFGISQTLPYLVLLESKTNKNWIDGQYLNELSRLSKALKQINGVKNVISLANIETAVTDKTSFNVGRIKDIAKNASQREKFLVDPLIAPHLISNDGTHAALIVETKSLSFKEQIFLMKSIKYLTSQKPSYYSTQIGGPPAISAQMADLLGSEIGLYSALSLVISLLILFAIFKNLSVLLISFLIIMTSNIISIGLLSFLGISLTVLSSTVPIIVTLSVVSMTAQTLSRLADFKDIVLERHRHIVALKVMKSLIGSHLLATMTTAIGFATLMSSQIPIISDYGMSVTISIITTAIISILLLTACAVWFPIPKKRTTKVSTDYAVEFLIQYKKPLFLSVLAMSLTGAAMGGYLNWSTLLFDDLPSQHPVKKATLFAEEKFGGVIPLEISIGSKTEKEPWKSSANVRKLAALIEEWRKLEIVGSVIAYSDFIKATNQRRQIASENSSIAETLFIYSMSNNNPLEHFTTLDHQYARVSLRIKDVPSHQIQTTIHQMILQAKAAFPRMNVETSGLAATVHPINESLSRDLIYGFYTAMIWIVFILMFVFKSVRWALVAAIPNLVPPALLLGILAMFNTPIKPGIAIIFAISLGIAFNNTVYILGKLKKMTKALHYQHLPIEQLMKEELGPCLLSSLAVMAGFSVFLFSYFGINQMFGTFMVLSVVAGLLGDLVLLPTMLALFPGLLIRPIIESSQMIQMRSYMFKNQKYIVSSILALIVVFLVNNDALAS
ncbi:MMPL family transporter, partial [bacterium]|nr:MMPL family transporter [bacterium]